MTEKKQKRKGKESCFLIYGDADNSYIYCMGNRKLKENTI